MAFPQVVDPASPAGSDSPALGDDQIRAVKQLIVDLFGLPTTPTNITAAIMDVAADGTIVVPGLVRLGTIVDQKAILDGTATWNDAVDTFKAILVNITDTASAAASLLIDLQVGGVSKFAVDKTGKVTAGIVPLARMQRTEVIGSNAGSVTLLGTVTIIQTIDLGTINAGDRILVEGWARSAKGGTAGETLISIQKSSGSATIVFTNANSATPFLLTNVKNIASQIDYFSISGFIRVTVSGTLVLGLFGQSTGSDSTIVANEGAIYALVLNNA